MEFPGENLLIKMWETLIEKGLGGLIEPYYTPWRNKKLALGQIEVDRIITDGTSSAEKEIIQIRNKEPLLIEQNQTTSNYNNISQPISVQDIVILNNAKRLIREEINVTNSIKYASQRLINDYSEVPKTEINDDWLNAWREHASKVSDEDVQSLWGNVLAQEFIKPGRYSLRLLEFIKTLSKSEALVIEKIAPYTSVLGLVFDCSISNTFSNLPDESYFIEETEIDREDLELLEEIGIITGLDSLGMFLETSNLRQENEIGYLSGFNLNKDIFLMISSQTIDKNLKISYFKITKIGREVLSLISYETKPSHLSWLANKMPDEYELTLCKKIENDLKPIHIFNSHKT